MYPLLFHFGHIGIPTYGVCTALALLAALALSVREARRLGLRADKVWNLGLVAILATLMAGRLLLVLTHLRAFRAHPFWVLGLATISGQWVALGSVLIGLLAALLYDLAEGLPLLRTADAMAPAAALGFAINRFGAFLAGLDWGRRTTLPWGVTYRSVVAYLWYRVPLGIRLQPVQLYDAAFSAVLLVILLRMPRRRDGEAMGTWLFAYGVARFFLEFLRGDETRERILGGALTFSQGLAVLAVIAGGALWMARNPEQEPVAVQPS